MNRRVHFISGLPRSGSTLLCAILRQNPRFSAAMTSPVANLVNALIPKMSAAGEFGSFFDNDRRRGVLRSVFDAYHAGAPHDGVVFDTNRSWTGKLPLLADLYPEMRIICCVRDVAWIIDSIECMLRRNPLEVARFVKASAGASFYARADALMDAQNGLVGLAWSTLREAWFSDRADRLIVVGYDGLVADPTRAVERLYGALGEPPFRHDFDRLDYDAPAFDNEFGMPGLHTVRPRIARVTRELAIPPDIVSKYADSQFWRLATHRKAGRPTIVC